MGMRNQAGVHLRGFVLRHVRPLADRRRDEYGWCNVCGFESRLAFNSWVIPRDQVLGREGGNEQNAYIRREGMFCRKCRSSLRVRSITQALLDLYGRDARSLVELVKDDEFRALDVAEINPIGSAESLHRVLTRLPRLAFSSYRDPKRLGQRIGGVRNEDMCNLTYPDAAFDLVLSSDTLEHVPDYVAALRETRRVLRPNGRHIFTVPVIASRRTTLRRAHYDGEGRLIHDMPPLYHGRGAGLYRYLPVGEDLLTFTEFGRDLSEHLQSVGFEARVMGATDELDQTGAAWVFSAKVVARGNITATTKCGSGS